MKSQEPQEKKFRQLSDQELEKVTGGLESDLPLHYGRCITKTCLNSWTIQNGCKVCLVD